VGVLVWRDEKLLLIERARGAVGFALPAGHVDDDSSYEESAKRELQEEVGLIAQKLTLVAEGRKENSCRRQDGTWHYWKLYQAETVGEVERSIDETKQANWYTKEEIKELAYRTQMYMKGGISNEEWVVQPGLEPVMYEWFKELKIVD
jgi:ADP-ribose pyrophosphatase YjhB (NUDIX family)